MSWFDPINFKAYAIFNHKSDKFTVTKSFSTQRFISFSTGLITSVFFLYVTLCRSVVVGVSVVFSSPHQRSCITALPFLLINEKKPPTVR